MNMRKILKEILRDYFKVGYDCRNHNIISVKNELALAGIDPKKIEVMSCKIYDKLRVKAESIFNDVDTIQKNYRYLVRRGNFSKDELEKLIMSFRNKYKTSEVDTLRLIRGDLFIEEIVELLTKQ